jgi:hypothetical protein
MVRQRTAPHRARQGACDESDSGTKDIDPRGDRSRLAQRSQDHRDGHARERIQMIAKGDIPTNQNAARCIRCGAFLPPKKGFLDVFAVNNTNRKTYLCNEHIDKEILRVWKLEKRLAK